MSVFALNPKEQQRFDIEARRNAIHPSQMEPSTFEGFWPAVGEGFMRGGARTAQAVGMLGSLVPMAIDKFAGDDNYSGKTLTERYFKALDEYVNSAVDYWVPDPLTIGFASRIAGGIAEIGIPMISGFGSPAATAGMVAGTATAGAGVELARSGVPGGVSGAVAAIQGGAAAAGLAIPFLGKTLASRVGGGVAGNVLTGAGADALSQQILSSKGYEEEAMMYDPLHPETRAIEALTGGLFGGFAHWSSKHNQDAALTAANAKHFHHDTAPGIPNDLAAHLEHQRALEKALYQLTVGEPVDARVDGSKFMLKKTRGFLNNNPGNIRLGKHKWEGQISGNDKDFVTFDSPEAGITAMVKLLLNYEKRRGLNTVAGIINRWAPPKENNTTRYVQAVAKELGVKPDDVLNVRDPETLTRLVAAIIRHENGQQPYPTEMLREIVESGLAGKRLARKQKTDILDGLSGLATEPGAQKNLAVEGFLAVGKTAKAVTERGGEINTQYAVVDISNLITSHDNNLQKNPDYPSEMQPRDRSRVASEAQISRIENAINPELLAESPRASDGAPIVGADKVVESGNARIIAIRRAYEGGKADQYRQWLIDNAERFGIEQSSVAEIKRPVLVRVGVDKYNRVEFARQANESPIAQMSPTEIARADAARLPDLEGVEFDEKGDINIGKSLPFIRDFIRRAVSPSEQGTMVTADGDLSQTGRQRIRNAVFARAYGDPDVISMLLESTDANVRNILSGMLRTAPAVARIRDLMEAGARPRFDFVEELVQAVRQLSNLRHKGLGVQQALGQLNMYDGGPSPEFRALLLGIEENARSPKRIADLIRRMVDAIDSLGDPRTGKMFGDLETPTANEIITESIKSARDAREVMDPDSPEAEAALHAVEANPDMLVVLDDGTEVSALEAMSRLQEEAKRVDDEVNAIRAVVTCYMRS